MAAGVDLPRPIAGVFGHLSERIDLALLEATADRGVSLLLVGSRKPSFSLESLTARSNVRYLGPKPFESMTGYLRAIDVGLTPYTQSEFNRSSFPMKTIEYLAAGRPAVATSLPAVKWTPLKTSPFCGIRDSLRQCDLQGADDAGTAWLLGSGRALRALECGRRSA
ncbi:glycosyltransferase [Pararhizobium sp. LjRoot235]|uniref:glycosyltransferase n=1 Tax=Pararhizobium sp. LjRoot235 TaxID=3342291 RepID=UPI003F4F7793